MMTDKISSRSDKALYALAIAHIRELEAERSSLRATCYLQAALIRVAARVLDASVKP